MALLSWLIGHWMQIVIGIVAALKAAIIIALIVPGPEPERTLQKIVDFLEKISRRPSQ